MRISDWSSDVCSSDLGRLGRFVLANQVGVPQWCDGREPGLRHDLVDGVRYPQGLAGLEGFPGFRGFRDHRRQRRDTAGASDQQPLEVVDSRRSEEHTSELQSLMRISYAVF